MSLSRSSSRGHAPRRGVADTAHAPAVDGRGEEAIVRDGRHEGAKRGEHPEPRRVDELLDLGCIRGRRDLRAERYLLGEALGHCRPVAASLGCTRCFSNQIASAAALRGGLPTNVGAARQRAGDRDRWRRAMPRTAARESRCGSPLAA